MCTLSLYDVIGITCHLHIKLKSFSHIGQPLHKEAEGGCSFLYITAKKSVIMSEVILVDVSIGKYKYRFEINQLSLPKRDECQISKNYYCKTKTKFEAVTHNNGIAS